MTIEEPKTYGSVHELYMPRQVPIDEFSDLKSIIYRIYNTVNKQSYIGKGNKSFITRYGRGEWWRTTHNPILKRDIKRYGKEVFIVSILGHSLPKEELEAYEAMMIECFDSLYPNGYNLVIGDGHKKQFCPYVKKQHSDRTRGENHPGYGQSKSRDFRHTDDALRRISLRRKGTGNRQNKNAVLQIDPKTFSEVGRFSCTEEAAKHVGCSAANIYAAINRKKNQLRAAGFMWKYETERKKRGAILQIDHRTGQAIQEFTNAVEAGKAVGIRASANIFSVCNGRRYTCGGFKWAYKDTYETT